MASESEKKFVLKEGKFNLFNSKIEHEDEKNHPDLYGSANIEGVPYVLAGWTTTNEKGTTYVSGVIKIKVDTTPVEADTTNNTASKKLF